MNKFLRLTVHVTDVQKIDASTGKRTKNASGKFINETKRKIQTQISQIQKPNGEILVQLFPCSNLVLLERHGNLLWGRKENP